MSKASKILSTFCAMAMAASMIAPSLAFAGPVPTDGPGEGFHQYGPYEHIWVNFDTNASDGEITGGDHQVKIWNSETDTWEDGVEADLPLFAGSGDADPIPVQQGTPYYLKNPHGEDAYGTGGFDGEVDVQITSVKNITGEEQPPIVGEDIINVTVPGNIVLAYRSDGTIIGPSADAYRIQNQSIVPVYLDANAVWATGDVSKAQTEAPINLSINGAQRTTGEALDIGMMLDFDDDGDHNAVMTVDPDAKVTLEDGTETTALATGHRAPINEYDVVTPDQIAIPGSVGLTPEELIDGSKNSVGADFDAWFSDHGENLGKFLTWAEAKDSIASIGTLIWQFSTEAAA